MKNVFMGSPEFAVATLAALLNSHHEIKLVITQPDKPANRGQKITPCPVAVFARENNIAVSQPQAVKNNLELFKQLEQLKPDVIVVTAYGKILPKEILNIPPNGCVNVHASLLPRYRGAAPINWTIINGEAKTGVTTMLMNERMDEGDILLQCETSIMPHDTAINLHDHLASLGGELLVSTLDQMEKGQLKSIPQDHSKATYTQKLKKEDGLIDWKGSAASIYNRIRGLQPWPNAFTRIAPSNILFIFDAAVIEEETKKAPGTIISLEGGIIVATGFGKLCILDVQAAGKRRMAAVEFLRGYKLKIGDRFI